MKKTILLIATFLAGSFILLSPIVRAQATETLDSTPADTTSSSTTDTTTDKPVDAGVPDTGFAPTKNKVLANASVFIVGSVLGGALGYSAIKLRKKV